MIDIILVPSNININNDIMIYDDNDNDDNNSNNNTNNNDIAFGDQAGHNAQPLDIDVNGAFVLLQPRVRWD